MVLAEGLDGTYMFKRLILAVTKKWNRTIQFWLDAWVSGEDPGKIWNRR